MGQEEPTDTNEKSDVALDTVFGLLGDETRADILRVLGEDPHTDQSFSELRSRLDRDVDSGKFNYHLQQLCGHFVEQTDEGYSLRPEGLTLYRTIRAGTFTERLSIDDFEAGFDCHFCGAGVEARYGDGTLEMQCPGCEYQYVHTRLPPSAIDPEDPQATFDLIDQYNRHKILALSNGVCPICVNELDIGFIHGEDVWAESAARIDPFVAYSCDHCGNQHYLTVGLSLLYHPTLIAFFHDHGIDVTSVPHWKFEFAMTDHAVTIHSTDPWEVTLRVTRAEETLELTVDDDLTVLRENRE